MIVPEITDVCRLQRAPFSNVAAHLYCPGLDCNFHAFLFPQRGHTNPLGHRTLAINSAQALSLGTSLQIPQLIAVYHVSSDLKIDHS